MVTLNLYGSERSDVKYKINRFPDGEVQITDLEVNKLESNMKIIAPIRNAEELFLFSQVMELVHKTIYKVNIFIPYLMGARNDRSMAVGRSVNLFNVLYIIDMHLLPKDTLTFITVHNPDAVSEWYEGEDREISFIMPYPEFQTNEEEMVIFPDAGAEKRFSHLVTGPYLVAQKSRDVNQEQSRILTYELLNPNGYNLDRLKKVYVIDDLSDGGGTFKLLSSELDKIGNFKKELYLTHNIQEKGLISLTDFYDTVHVCDTFKDVPFQSGLGIKILKKVEDMI